MVRSVAITFAVLLAIFETGSCLKCYQCNSQQDKNCGDPFNGAKYLVDCTTQESLNYNKQYLFDVLPAELFGVVGAPRYCHKIVMETNTVIRTCLDANPTNMNHSCKIMEDVSKLASYDKKIKYCNVCDKDNCNGASNLNFSLPLAFLTFVAAFLMWKQ